jgi:hypothetical protein
MGFRFLHLWPISESKWVTKMANFQALNDVKLGNVCIFLSSTELDFIWLGDWENGEYTHRDNR